MLEVATALKNWLNGSFGSRPLIAFSYEDRSQRTRMDARRPASKIAVKQLARVVAEFA